MALTLAARMATPKVPGDFQVYMAGARALTSGGSLYDVGIKSVVGILPFTYPPFAGVLLTPFLTLPIRTAFVIWGLVQVVALAAMSWVIARCLPGIAGRRAPGFLGTWWLALGIFTASLAFEPVAENFHYGQVNILVDLLVLIDTVLVTRGRGVLTGLAAGIKVTPGIFFLLMVTTRRWRDLFLAFAGLGFTVVVGALFGVGQEWRYWSRELLLTSRVGDPSRTPNASLDGIAQRALDVPEAGYLWGSVAALVLVSGLWIATVWWHRNHLISGTALGATALLISPISWTHHWIWAVPLTASLAALSARARRYGTPREFWSLVVVTVIVAFHTSGTRGDGSCPSLRRDRPASRQSRRSTPRPRSSVSSPSPCPRPASLARTVARTRGWPGQKPSQHRMERPRHSDHGIAATAAATNRPSCGEGLPTARPWHSMPHGLAK